MFIYIISACYWFFRVVEVALMVYIVIAWLPIFPKIQAFMTDIMNPLLTPVRRLIGHSVLRVRGIDLSPILLYLLAAFGSQLCMALR